MVDKKFEDNYSLEAKKIIAGVMEVAVPTQ